MAKKTDKLVEETPKEKPQIEDLLAEKDLVEQEEAKKAEDAAKAKEEEEKNPPLEVDLDEEKEKTKKEVLEHVEKEVVEPLKKEIIDLKETLAPQEKDDYDKFVEEYTAKNGKAPEWKQVATFLEERAVARVKEEQQAQEEAKKQEEETTKKAQEEQATENFKVWQGQLQEMEDKGLLPKMEKPVEGDKGFDARVKMYGLMQATWKTATPITNLWEVHTKFGDQLGTKEVPGADAPVSLGNGGTGESQEDYKYSEVHKGSQDLETFAMNELKKAGAIK